MYVVYIYTLYTPRIWDWQLPFPIRKGSWAALEEASKEQGLPPGVVEQHRRAKNEQKGA